MTREQLEAKVEEILADACRTGERAALWGDVAWYCDVNVRGLTERAMSLIDAWDNGAEAVVEEGAG